LETIFDWLTVIAFGGLVILFLQRSSQDEPPDTIWHYLPPAIGCAAANYLGNEGYVIPALALLTGAAAYTWIVLKPFPPRDG